VIGFYRDDAASGTSNCRDDNAWYGASGYIIETALPCTNAGCEDYFKNTQVIHYLGPKLSVADARQLSYWVYHPVEIAVSVASSE
jgi:hypothetical protein